MLASLCLVSFLIYTASAILIAVEDEATGLYEVYDSEEDYIFEDDDNNWEESVYLTPDEVSFYVQNEEESPIQFPTFWRFDLFGKLWQNVSKSDLTSLIRAYHSSVFVEALYEWEDGDAPPITTQGTGFHIDKYKVLTARHNIRDFICFAVERKGRRISEIGANSKGECNSAPKDRVLRKYVRKQIVTEWGYARIGKESATGKKYGAQRNDDIVMLQTGEKGNEYFVKWNEMKEIEGTQDLDVILIGRADLRSLRSTTMYPVKDGTVEGSKLRHLFGVGPSTSINSVSRKFISIGKILGYDYNGLTVRHSSPSWKASSGGLLVLAHEPFLPLGMHIGGQVNGVAYTVNHPFLRSGFSDNNQKELQKNEN